MSRKPPQDITARRNPSCDAIVIGGGIIGLSIAWRLAQDGLSVTLIERGPCGQEASWSGAGVLQCGSWHRKDPLVHLLRTSLRQYPAFAAELKDRTGIDPEFIPCGAFELLLEDQHYRMAASEVNAAEAYRESYGRTILELLPPEEARRREPNIAADRLGVKYNALTCQVRNPRLTAAARAACLLAGVRLVEHCAVRQITRDGGKVAGVMTDFGSFAAPHVVLAAGSWSSLIDPQVGQLVQVYPVRGQIVLLETPRRLFEHVIERGKCYMVPRLDGRIIVGATEEHECGFDKRNTAEGVNQLLTLCQKLVPALAGAVVAKTWAGLRPGTPDRGPYLGPVPGWSGLWSATGHFRSGLILAPITAVIISELIRTGRTQYDIARLAPGREVSRAKPMVEDPSGA
ncbi:MAG: glycine oxidase ThiO [Phycisphaerae bacterium]